MATTNTEFIPWYGTKAQYDAISEKDVGTVYFVTDEKLIFRGSALYGSQVKAVTSFPSSGIIQGLIYFNSSTGEAKYYDGSAWNVLIKPVATSITSGSTNDSAAGALAVYNYVTTAIGNLTVGLGGRLHPAVQNLDALEALTSVLDKDLCLVEDQGALYRYDAQSEDSASSPTVIVPDDGTLTGKWLKMATSISLTAGNGISISGLTISLNMDSEMFEFDANTGALKLKASVISGKADKVITATENHVAQFDANGNLKDGGFSVGGSTLAGTPNASTLATEAAVEHALEGVKVNWITAE